MRSLIFLILLAFCEQNYAAQSCSVPQKYKKHRVVRSTTPVKVVKQKTVQQMPVVVNNYIIPPKQNDVICNQIRREYLVPQGNNLSGVGFGFGPFYTQNNTGESYVTSHRVNCDLGE
jgi:hypothetical protein